MACSTATPSLVYPPADLRAELVARAGRAGPEALVVPHEVGPDLVARARALLHKRSSRTERLRVLAESLTAPWGFGLVYDPVASGDARTTLARGRGNCLSLTSLFIGLAREVGIRAFFVDASGRRDEFRREEGVVISSGHIAAGVRTERGIVLIDFAGELPRHPSFRTISDLEAVAHFHNNRGYQLIHEAQRAGRPVPWEEVRERFELAVRVHPGFARGHNNLGVAYARLGREREAAAAYRKAAGADPELAAAFHNLGGLYQRAGDLDAALDVLRKAAELEPRNPYVRYHLALVCLERGELLAAAEALERFVGLGGDGAQPRRLLARVYRALGRSREAEEVLAPLREARPAAHGGGA